MKEYRLEERTIGRILAEKAARVPDRTWLRWQDERYTFADAEAMTNRYANGFASLGVGEGDHVAVLLPNGPEFFWTIWGLGKLGAVAVPVNTAAKGELLRYFVDQSDSQWIAVDDESALRVAAIADSVPRVRGYLYHGAKAPADCGIVTRAPVLPLAELGRAPDRRPPLDAVRHDDLHLLMYTSGTTGPSKGVMSPHAQGHGVGWSLAKYYGYTPDDVIYTCLPLFHGNALWYSAYAALWAEAALAVAPRFSATTFWHDIRRFGATQFNTLGAMTNILWKLPPSPADRDHKLRLCMTVPVPKEIYRELQERYHVKITSVYAMTENCAVTLFTPDDPPEKAGSAGKTRSYAEIRIADDDGRECAPGETGEITMRATEPGFMMNGYYKMPEATAQQFRDGWFCTGDRGYVDADGYLYFVDRKKEAIRRRGENISAYEVELILSRHPKVLEVAAIPVSSELSEDDVMVYVVRREGERLTEDEVVAFCSENMAYFMVPRFVAFVEALPKTPSEKIEKYKLKREAEARRAELWDREKHGIVVKR